MKYMIYIDFEHHLVATENNIFEQVESSEDFKEYFRNGWNDGVYSIYSSFSDLSFQQQQFLKAELMEDWIDTYYQKYEEDLITGVMQKVIF